MLGSHVLKRAQDGPFLGERLVHRPGRRDLALQGGDPEVEQLRARFRQHDVGRLQIAVDDSLPVGVGECTGDLDREAQDLIERQRTSAQALREGFSLEMLHHDELNAALLADVVERADVRMADLGDGQGLALETLDALGILRLFWFQDLDRHRPVEAGVGRAIDLSHAAGAEPRNDRVGTQLDARPHVAAPWRVVGASG